MKYLIKILPTYGKYTWYVYYQGQMFMANGANTEDEANTEARKAADLHAEMYPEEGYSYDYQA